MSLADDGVGVVPSPLFPLFLHLRFVHNFLVGGTTFAVCGHAVIHNARHFAPLPLHLALTIFFLADDVLRRRRRRGLFGRVAGSGRRRGCQAYNRRSRHPPLLPLSSRVRPCFPRGRRSNSATTVAAPPPPPVHDAPPLTGRRRYQDGHATFPSERRSVDALSRSSPRPPWT